MSDQLRQELVATLRARDALPASAFDAKLVLSEQIADLRQRLADATRADRQDAADEWAERAGRKGSHEVDDEAAAAVAAAYMPGEGASG